LKFFSIKTLSFSFKKTTEEISKELKGLKPNQMVRRYVEAETMRETRAIPDSIG
jgi:hypothetical protein